MEAQRIILNQNAVQELKEMILLTQIFQAQPQINDVSPFVSEKWTKLKLDCSQFLHHGIL